MREALRSAADRALRRPPIAHLVRAQVRYSSRLGNHFAASITFFTVLAAVPVVAFSFATLSVVLTHLRPDIFDAVKDLVIRSLGSTGGAHKVTEVIDSSVRSTGSWGTLATTILVTLWTGVSWIGDVRSGVLAQWEPSFSMVKEDKNPLASKARDMLSFMTVLVVLLVVFATAQAGSALSGVLGRRLGLDLLPGHTVIVTISGLVVSTLAGALFFVFLYGILPRSRRNWSAILRGSLAAGVCLAAVQTGAGIVVRAVSVNRAVQAFGSIVVVMLVLNLLARIILFVAAWIATADQPAVAFRWHDADAPLEEREGAWTAEGHWRAAHADREAQRREAEGSGPDTTHEEERGSGEGQEVVATVAEDGRRVRAGLTGFLAGVAVSAVALLGSVLVWAGLRHRNRDRQDQTP